MKLDHIPLDRLQVDKSNMRHGRKVPDLSDILPTIRTRGVLQTLLVRPADAEGRHGIVAGRRRYQASLIVAEERRAAGQDDPESLLLPCAILDDGDDAAAIEASMIENMARLDPDEVRQWESFTRLVRKGRSVEDIALTFGLSDLAIRRVLALGNLLPRIRDLYRAETLDRASVRHLTLASKARQKDWLALHDDAEARAPTGHQLKAWLFGGQSIPARFALFDLAAYPGATVADLFGDDRYFADNDAFWAAQDAAVEARRVAYLAEGWAQVILVPPSEPFHGWDYVKTPKRKGGRVYIDVRASGEVTVHEGYLSRREAQAAERTEAPPDAVKPKRPELTATLQTYVDLHRHAAVRAALLAHPPVALRLMAAHAIAGSPLWTVRPEPQATRNDEVRESVECAPGEALFDSRRRTALALLGRSDEDATLVETCDVSVAGGHLAALFERLLALSDADVLAVIAVVIGETLAAGSAAVEAVGSAIGIDMADWWEADDALFGLIRDKALLVEIVREIAGDAIAGANVREKGSTLKRIAADHLAGADGRARVERWMRFAPSAYTARGGVGTVAAQAALTAARAAQDGDAAEAAEALPEGEADGAAAEPRAVQTPPLAA